MLNSGPVKKLTTELTTLIIGITGVGASIYNNERNINQDNKKNNLELTVKELKIENENLKLNNLNFKKETILNTNTDLDKSLNKD